MDMGSSTARAVTSVLTVPVSYRGSAFGPRVAPTAVPSRERNPSIPGMWNGESGASLNTVSARVGAGVVGTVWTPSAILVSRSRGVKVRVARGKVSPCVGALNAAARVSRVPEATINR